MENELMPWRRMPELDKAEQRQFTSEFRKKAKLLVDENLGPDVAGMLKRSGWNVKYAGDVGLAGHDDKDVLAFAFRENRVLLTHDSDFLDDRAFPEHRNPGLVVLPGGGGDVGALLEAIRLMLSVVGEFGEVWKGSKLTVGADDTVTVKNRNRSTGAMTTTRYKLTPDGWVDEWVGENEA